MITDACSTTELTEERMGSTLSIVRALNLFVSQSSLSLTDNYLPRCVLQASFIYLFQSKDILYPLLTTYSISR